MKHTEKRSNLYYAVLTVPEDVRHIVGKLRFVQSTQTSDKQEAALRVALLVAKWRTEIAKARGTLPNPKATFWESMRAEFMGAKDEAHESAVQDVIEQAVGLIADPVEASQRWLQATGQATPLLPLVDAWKGSLKLALKTIDQQHRDVLKMADHFVSLEALKPQRVKAWTDGLIEKGATAATLERILNGCRSLWRWLQDSETLPVDTADPFAGSFRLAVRRAKRNTIDRQAFTADELSRVHQEATQRGDLELARLIALGAYTGARIEELCSLTTANCSRGDSKTDAGVRQVPVHPALTELVALMVASSNDGFLVPSKAAGKYGVRSDPLSKKFGRLKESLGFGPGHVFHSIRKTMATMLEQAGVAEGTAADILGHEKKTLSYGLYSSGTSMAQKLEAMTKVRYPGTLGFAVSPAVSPALALS
jgi:integrase